MPPLIVIGGYLLLCALWGSTWAAIKIGVSSVPPFVFALERAIAVSLVLTVLSIALGHRFPRDGRTILAAVVAGVINIGTSWSVIFWSEQYVPSGLVSVFGAMGPLWTAFLAHFFVHGDRLSPVKIGGLVLGLIGVGILVGSPSAGTAPEALLASVLLALMPVTWAIATIVQVRLLRSGSPIPLVAIGTWAGALFLLPFGLTQLERPGSWALDTLLAFGYLVVFGSCVGLVLQLWLTRRLRPTTMMLAQLLISAEALTVGGLALGEAVTWRMLAGAAFVAAAVGVNAFAGTDTSTTHT